MRLVELYKPYLFFRGVYVYMLYFLFFFWMQKPAIFSVNFLYVFVGHDSFDDMNTEKLRMAVRESGAEADVFYFDPKCIDWDEYFLNTHLPGVVKHVFK